MWNIPRFLAIEYTNDLNNVREIPCYFGTRSPTAWTARQIKNQFARTDQGLVRRLLSLRPIGADCMDYEPDTDSITIAMPNRLLVFIRVA